MVGWHYGGAATARPDPDVGDVFERWGIDAASGCIAVVRPDQYVAHILSLAPRAGWPRPPPPS